MLLCQINYFEFEFDKRISQKPIPLRKKLYIYIKHLGRITVLTNLKQKIMHIFKRWNCISTMLWNVTMVSNLTMSCRLLATLRYFLIWIRSVKLDWQISIDKRSPCTFTKVINILLNGFHSSIPGNRAKPIVISGFESLLPILDCATLTVYQDWLRIIELK